MKRVGRWTSSAMAGILAGAVAIADAQQAATPRELAIKYVRDSEEYSALARQVYRSAGEAVIGAVPEVAGQRWGVVLDIDETALDNSAYQLERAAYGLPFDLASWGAFVRRAESGAVPGGAWPSTPIRVLAFVGDQMNDFPDASEEIPHTGSDACFSRTCFLLPNPMYGDWTTRVTRRRP